MEVKDIIGLTISVLFLAFLNLGLYFHFFRQDVKDQINLLKKEIEILRKDVFDLMYNRKK